MFRSQKEFAQALLDGRKFINNKDDSVYTKSRLGCIYQFKNGFKVKQPDYEKLLDMDEYDWCRYDKVEEYREPQWYDNIPEEGVLCWVHNKNPEGKVRMDLIAFFDSIEAEGEERFQSCFANWKYATPLTKEEVMKFIYQGDKNE